ncbi:ATP-binding cassette domain-containing protein [Kineosporia sp. J2-2]|uniref:ATP-binding cassette domain-containing protein n=1 Tax=Kineosporia corallincola TaxID=2835133 RepID=A0ABS5TKL3_9ACTN|nr:ATP-binding cassette domain-containing protein [Kineosporia corallincola]MBT0771649.1 ATP-binding cassette domain-containing protein [Kineosporia corallincola]
MRDLSFDVRPGVVTGFLGPNGAGKSTTMRLMLRLCLGGGVTTFGGRRVDQMRQPTRTVGAMLDPTAHHPRRSARAHVRMLAAAAGTDDRRVDEVLGLVGLTDVAGRASGGFSLGMQQRLALAAALVGDPEYLILDEPANGLDPQGIRWLRDFLTTLTDEGRTVLLSSHQLAEMAQTADEVIVLGRGRIITQGPLGDFVDRFTRRHVLIRTPTPHHLADCLHANGIGPVTPRGPDGLVVAGETSTDEIGELAAHYGVVLHELSPHSSSLEDAFLEATATSTEYTTHPTKHPTKHQTTGRGR